MVYNHNKISFKQIIN